MELFNFSEPSTLCFMLVNICARTYELASTVQREGGINGWSSDFERLVRKDSQFVLYCVPIKLESAKSPATGLVCQVKLIGHCVLLHLLHITRPQLSLTFASHRQ